MRDRAETYRGIMEAGAQLTYGSLEDNADHTSTVETEAPPVCMRRQVRLAIAMD